MTAIPRIDWSLAQRVGGYVVPAGPSIPLAEATATVDDLYEKAERAADIIDERSGLNNPHRVPVAVVDRPGWVAANATMADELLQDLVPSKRSLRAVAAVTGAQVGIVLAVVSTRIIGQFEGLSSTPRLLLVAPNVVAVETSLGFNKADFRLWACLHEQTHQFQFGHAPWLADHVRGLAAELLGEVDDDSQDDPLTRLTAAMTYLEGHAEVHMDIAAVGTITSLPKLRRALDRRRRSPGLFAVVQRMVGLNQKVSQYERGAVFCRYLHDRGGLDVLNRPLSEPELLPTMAEIDDPDLWFARVS